MRAAEQPLAEFKAKRLYLPLNTNRTQPPAAAKCCPPRSLPPAHLTYFAGGYTPPRAEYVKAGRGATFKKQIHFQNFTKDRNRRGSIFFLFHVFCLFFKSFLPYFLWSTSKIATSLMWCMVGAFLRVIITPVLLYGGLQKK